VSIVNRCGCRITDGAINAAAMSLRVPEGSEAILAVGGAGMPMLWASGDLAAMASIAL
jgi:hypothetical protein